MWKWLICGTLIILFVGIAVTYSWRPLQTSSDIVKAQSPLKVYFERVEDEKIKANFLNVWKKYESLHPYKVVLTTERLESTTMQAQPIFSFSSFFGETRSYQIKLGTYVKDSNNFRVVDLPDAVLSGWFAHELGHLVDYERYNTLEMLWYGIKYTCSETFKKNIEHTADRIAVVNGFYQEIIASKKFILENNLLGERYKDQIKQYYMSIEEVELLAKELYP